MALGMLAIVAGGIVLTSQGVWERGGVLGPLAVVGACAAWGLARAKANDDMEWAHALEALRCDLPT